MDTRQQTDAALREAWHEEAAANSIERWLELVGQARGRHAPDNLQLLVRIFGASWYFTRLIFYLGDEAVWMLDDPETPVLDGEFFLSRLQPALEAGDFEAELDDLRLRKNTCMLRILKAWFESAISLEEMERALTVLADATLNVLIRILRKLPQHADIPVTILGMGRTAGHEMTFGSDLDLIFLHESGDQEAYGNLGKTIRLLLRVIAQPASTGKLYDVDMRLRPHGNSGPLVTSYGTFMEYHGGERDVWEKQMMTRCRPVLVLSNNLDPVMQSLNNRLYADYDCAYLRREITGMRIRVQKELGSPRGKYEIKRGYGGLMDIDFITHYFQLCHGLEHPSLQTGSTRGALRELAVLGLVETDTTTRLIGWYDYLKTVETALRLFDMKSIDSFTSADDGNHTALSRAMGHGDDVPAFLEEYEAVTHGVRRIFEEYLGRR